MQELEKDILRDTRYVIGIDLGTTNIAVTYVDLEADERQLKLLEIPQLVNPGEVDELELLPSFYYHPFRKELPEGALVLPWSSDQNYVVGHFARDHGAAVPGRMVNSAKSWLAHAGVDRTKGILPWGGDLGEDSVSPVYVSSCYLAHIRAAWDQRFGKEKDRNGTPCILAEQQVILTVPASFDEIARELTVQAAKDAGLEQIVLLEEPLAAFYSWLWQHEQNWKEHLQEGDRVLVIDVGGGTTDFSLIEIEPGYTLRRTAVGEHLLLGGDNMDMALARHVEVEWNKRLETRQWSMLCQECRRAKEVLLTAGGPESEKVSVTGSSSSVIAGTETGELSADTVKNTILDGFFTVIDAKSPAPTRRGGMRKMGLPYAADPAVTKHLLEFLRHARRTTDAHSEKDFVKPTRILLNGGALQPRIIQERLSTIVGEWCGLSRLPVLEAQNLNLAVSRGATYYGLVRLGSGVRVKGGIARSYYLEVAEEEKKPLLCVMPRDTEEGVVVDLGGHTFLLKANHPVQFPLYSSATRLGDQVGDRIEHGDEVTALPPLRTVLAHGKHIKRELEVQLSSMLNEIGTLDLWCTTKDGQHRYPLSFDVRATVAEPPTDMQGVTVSAVELEAAKVELRAVFEDQSRLPRIMSILEQTVDANRDEWGALLLRALGDEVLSSPELRKKTAEHELRWLNLVGYLLRPGFGAPGDDWRVKQLWKIWHSGPLSSRHPQVKSEWWICWRRIAGGLRAGHQQQLGSVLLKELLPKKGNKLGPQKAAAQEAREMWRCLGALERLSVKDKTNVMQALLRRGVNLQAHHWWVAARLGARQLFHGPENAVIPAAEMEALLSAVFARIEGRKPSRMMLFALANMCRYCAVRSLDIRESDRRHVAELFERYEAPVEWKEHLFKEAEDSSEYQAEVVGDRLPLGLSLKLAGEE